VFVEIVVGWSRIGIETRNIVPGERIVGTGVTVRINVAGGFTRSNLCSLGVSRCEAAERVEKR